MERVISSYGSTKYTGYAPTDFMYSISNESETLMNFSFKHVCYKSYFF